jgi:dTDP-4-dehydrorhamnose reductase
VLDPLNVAMAGREYGATFVYYSTDYIFDGTNGPNKESDLAKPLSVYGRVKLEAEDLLDKALGKDLLCLRTAWVQGPERQGKNFTYQVWRNLSQGKTMVCPSDQVSNPTYGPDLAKFSIDLVLSGESGIWNVAGPDLVARDVLGREIAQKFGFDPAQIMSKTTAELNQPAARPLQGGLDTSKLQQKFLSSLRPLHKWLDDFMMECQSSQRINEAGRPVSVPWAQS